MEKYFVIIDGKKKLVTNKIQADNILIDAFLSGIKEIDWNLYKNDEPKEKSKE